MNFNPVADQDPHGVQALLQLLRSQQDSQQNGQVQLQASQEYDPAAPAPARPWAMRQPSAPAASWNAPLPSSYMPTAPPRAAAPPSPEVPRKREQASSATLASASNLRSMSFAQALPILTKLATDEKFLGVLLELKAEQDDLERKLSKELLTIRGADGKNLRESGAAGALAPSRLTAWTTRASEQWDACTLSQQERLEKLGVPSFFATTERAALERQARVLDVLHGLLEG